MICRLIGRTWWAPRAAVITVLLIVSATLLSCGSKDDSKTSGSPAATAMQGSAAGSQELVMRDNLFEYQGRRRPNIEVAAGQQVSLNLVNNGTAAHNVRMAGLDGQYESSDDIVSRPDTVQKGEKATLAFKIDKAGAYSFRCDFHETEMAGTVTVK